MLLGGVGRNVLNLLVNLDRLEGAWEGVMDRDPRDVPRPESDDLPSSSVLSLMEEDSAMSSDS